MTHRSAWRPLALAAAVCLTGAALLVACSSGSDGERSSRSNTPSVSSTPGDSWSAALQKTPYPYKLPLPEPTQTALDGTYIKVEPSEGEPVHCLRCPDYSPEGGIWKLHLDRGVFRVYHQDSGWHSMGSFVLSKDQRTSGTSEQLVLFNDPACPGYVGTYAWRTEQGALLLDNLEDTCSIHMRALNLTSLPWLSCHPPNAEAGTTGHWQEPAGCE